MAEKWILDKALKVGTLYRCESDKYLVIRNAGTNSTTKATLKVEGAPVLETVDVLAKLADRDVERFPPFNLKDCFIVVPPDKTIEVEGESGKAMRIVGELWNLAPGEVVPSAMMARYSEQPKKYYTYQSGIGGIGEAATWADGVEHDVIDFTAPAGEKHTFARMAYVKRTGVIADDTIGAVAIRIYVNDRPLDAHDPAKLPLGVDTIRGHLYADTTNYYYPCSFEEMPIVLQPGHKLTIKARNISGAAITTAAGEEAKVQVTIVDEKLYL